MQYILHLTERCLFACRYCRLAQRDKDMDPATVLAAIDLALADSAGTVGIGFYGGEPLLRQDLIRTAVDYAVSKNTDKRIFFKLTTNGRLLDKAFCDFAAKNKIFISLSLDGGETSHNMNRLDHDGNGTYQTSAAALALLLRRHPFTPVMTTVAPNTAPHLSDSVRHIFSLGVRNLLCTLDYGADWNEDDLTLLRKEYKRLAAYYTQEMEAERNIFFSPFESKINSHVKNRTYCAERCQLGYDQISVGTDGTLYPCIQFAGDRAYQIGHVDSGIDQGRRREIFKQSRVEQTACKTCAIRDRCLHTCACINKCTTGSLSKPSPVLCAHERMLIPIADGMAAKLYKKRSGLFIHKHYNNLYPMIALVEEFNARKGADSP
jgi:uncharacterized protein